MKLIKSFIATIALALFAFTSCDKDELEISKENVLGQWEEDYSNYPYYASEGGVTYTFNSNGTVDVHYYDVFAGDHDVQRTYSVGTIETTSGMENDILLLDPHMSDYSGEGFKIVKLTKTEMEWQRLGTTFQKGTVGSDFKHLIRKK